MCKNVGLWPWMHVHEVFTIFWALQILFHVLVTRDVEDVHSENKVVITTILKLEIMFHSELEMMELKWNGNGKV
jgi:hypothetical protein